MIFNPAFQRTMEWSSDQIGYFFTTNSLCFDADQQTSEALKDILGPRPRLVLELNSIQNELGVVINRDSEPETADFEIGLKTVLPSDFKTSAFPSTNQHNASREPQDVCVLQWFGNYRSRVKLGIR